MKTARMTGSARVALVTIAVAVLALVAAGCVSLSPVWGTPDNPNVGLTPPYLGSDWGWFADPNVGPVDNTVTFHTCTLHTGRIQVGLRPDANPNGSDQTSLGAVFTATITEPSGVSSQLMAVGDLMSTTHVLQPGDCFSVVLSAPVSLVPNVGCANPIPACNPTKVPFVDTWPGTDYTISW